jgi:hypothetical protein
MSSQGTCTVPPGGKDRDDFLTPGNAPSATTQGLFQSATIPQTRRLRDGFWGLISKNTLLTAFAPPILTRVKEYRAFDLSMRV